jgi:hypothetical protein
VGALLPPFVNAALLNWLGFWSVFGILTLQLIILVPIVQGRIEKAKKDF